MIFEFAGAVVPVDSVDRKLDLLVGELEFRKLNGLGQMFGLLLKDICLGWNFRLES